MDFILRLHSPIIPVDGDCDQQRICGSITRHFQRHEIRHEQTVSGNSANCRLEHGRFRPLIAEHDNFPRDTVAINFCVKHVDERDDVETWCLGQIDFSRAVDIRSQYLRTPA